MNLPLLSTGGNMTKLEGKMNINSKQLKPLKQENLGLLSTETTIAVPQYDREKIGVGIVHLGPGAFHRSHQAFFTENAIHLSGGDWAICGVSLRQGSPASILAKQDNLYTLAILDSQPSYRIIGVMKEFLVLREQRLEVMQRMTAETTKIVTLTITEKGYCLASNGALDLLHQDIKHDLENPTTPISAIGLIVETLNIRKQQGIKAYNVLSCDNVSGNGDKLQRAVLDYAGKLDENLQRWIKNNVAFPNSMVDSITPKTEDYTIESVSAAIKLQDNWPIQREEFTQWVIDNNWQGERPDWQSAGVIFTDDVEGFEKAKLRLLNCLHSTLAYAGSLANFETVFDAANDSGLQYFITKLAREEVIGSFTPPAELDVHTYTNDIIQRFLNPEIRHLLAQIAFDGSQKIQVRIIPIIKDNVRLKRPTKLLTLSLVCWFEFICKSLREGHKINDPMAETFSKMPDLLHGNAQDVVESFLSLDSIFSQEITNNKQIKKELISHLVAIRQGDISDIKRLIQNIV